MGLKHERKIFAFLLNFYFTKLRKHQRFGYWGYICLININNQDFMSIIRTFLCKNRERDFYFFLYDAVPPCAIHWKDNIEECQYKLCNRNRFCYETGRGQFGQQSTWNSGGTHQWHLGASLHEQLGRQRRQCSMSQSGICRGSSLSAYHEEQETDSNKPCELQRQWI